MKLKSTIALLVLAFSLTQCKKDLTTSLVGKYRNNIHNYEIVVSKVDEITLSIALDDDYFFYSSKINSNTTFTLKTIVVDNTDYTYSLSGNGTLSNGIISISVNYSDSFGENHTHIYSGTKQ